MPETSSHRFGDLRGVQWRVDLGILPSPPASIDDLRRVTANSRRRYAALRKQLLVDPHVPKDGGCSPDPVMDNPLSQNPDSMWGRFFRNAELERMLDQDLTRLYPERGSYFQTSGCQGMLRRILLLWCLSHPEYGYRQGMHELLAPLLYVLHVDGEHLSEVRKAHEDHFADKFDGLSYHENDLMYKFDIKKFSESVGDGSELEKNSAKASTLTDLDPVIQAIVLLSDAYGAEGELGIVLSEKFMEHDAYSMFDALMSGAGGGVAMAEFFSPSPYRSSHNGFTPVLEASAALYHLLSVVDSSLHTHLVELGVEPQYFSLRWLRVLFGREFSLEDLLVIWDEIFACDNTKINEGGDDDADSNFGVLDSARGMFISSFAVSMILTLRSSLLATDNATVCLQRLLSFPDDINLVTVVAKAKTLYSLVVDMNSSNSLVVHPDLCDGRKPRVTRVHSLPVDSSSPRTPLNTVPESYWEEKWRVLNKEQQKEGALKEQQEEGALKEQAPSIRKDWSARVRSDLSRTESDPSSSTKNSRVESSKPYVRRSLLDDLSRQLGPDENTDCNDVTDKKFSNTLSGAPSEEKTLNFSDPPTPTHGSSDHENEPESSSVASNSSIDENDAESCVPVSEFPAESCAPVSEFPADGFSSKPTKDDGLMGKPSGTKQKKALSGKFNWLWRRGRAVTVETSEKPGGCDQSNVTGFCITDGCESTSPETSKEETVDQNLMISLRYLGQSMLENIQVIESTFQEGQTENLSKEGKVTAMSALDELRKISNLLLSEM